jgi:cation-transporting ATPase E
MNNAQFHSFDRVFREIGYIVIRNVFILINTIIFAVVVLLLAFGATKAGIFLGFILFLNIALGLVQEIRAWLSLRNLQLLTALRVTRLGADGAETVIFAEEVAKGDRVKLTLGDQVPCDGRVAEVNGLEINEGLITGESDSVPRSIGDLLLAGSIITAGSCIVRAETVFQESRISRMTEGVKKYEVSVSPIQKAVGRMIRALGYVLLAAIAFVVVRGFVVHEDAVLVVKHVGALASLLVPQGLVFTMTLLFAYGAAHLFNRNVLLQEVNATEKLGRIRNLCMDKTGTLTENSLVVEAMRIPEGISEDEAKELTATYIDAAGDSSRVIVAIKKFIGVEHSMPASGVLPFSSWRQYGAVRIEDERGKRSILVGKAEIFLSHLSDPREKEWLEALLAEYAKQGKYLLSVARSDGTLWPDDIDREQVSLVAVFISSSPLREGIRESIAFFQDRGVRIRILSGDNPDTVRAVASAAGVNDTDRVVTSEEMDRWTDEEFRDRIDEYTIFAHIKPEQKERIVSALRTDGFTAMVGDGANDALAIKKADLGIAMFDGAPATRQLAAVVLMNNSFTALPGGVQLADNIIRSAEIFAAMFFSQTFLGLFFFLIVSALGYAFPITPLNITLVNYFTVGLPGMLVFYWAIRPPEKAPPTGAHGFLERVLPIAIRFSVVAAFSSTVVFLSGPLSMRMAPSDTPVLLSFMVFGAIFLIAAQRYFQGVITREQWKFLAWFGIGEIGILTVAFHIPFALDFFEVSVPSFPNLVLVLVTTFLLGGAYLMAEAWLAKGTRGRGTDPLS